MKLSHGFDDPWAVLQLKRHKTIVVIKNGRSYSCSDALLIMLVTYVRSDVKLSILNVNNFRYPHTL